MVNDAQQRKLDLDIEVTPAIEDAFYFLKHIDDGIPDIEDYETAEEYETRLDRVSIPSIKAGERLTHLSKSEAFDAIDKGQKMLENLKKYGIPSSRWP